MRQSNSRETAPSSVAPSRIPGETRPAADLAIAAAPSDRIELADQAGDTRVTRLAWPKLPLSATLTNGIPLEHRTYLRNGKILIWEGPVEDVLSPVCVED